MSIRLKLIFSFIGVSLIGAVIGLIGTFSLLSIKAADENSYKNGTMGIVSVMKIFQAFDTVKVAIRDEALSTDMTENLRIEGVYKNGVQELKKNLASYAETVADAQDLANYNALKTAVNNYLLVSDKVMELGVVNKNDEAAKVMTSPSALKVRTDMGEAVQRMIDFNLNYVKLEFQANSQLTDFSIFIMIFIMAVGIAVSVLLGLLVTNSITRPMKRVNEELGAASRALESASGQVSSSSQQLSSSSNELASSIEEMTSSLEELQSIIEANTKNVNQSELLMQETLAESKKVSEKMADLKLAMGDISGNSKKISKIIKVIDDIAFQTNILALNAAVEAARAGDAGKGFAVVADQVKALAQKSADAAKETADLIEMAISAAEKGETLGTTASENQILAVDKTGKVAVLLDEVNRASKEQLKGANQITQAVNQVNGVVQNTASSSEENAAAGEELLGQSVSLADNVEQLNIIINGKKKNSGGSRSAGPAPRPPKSENPGPAKPAAAAKNYSLPQPQTHPGNGIEVTKPEDVIPLKDFKDF